MFNQRIVIYLLIALLPTAAFASKQQTVWEPLNTQLTGYQVEQTSSLQALFNANTFSTRSDYSLQFLKDTHSNNITHIRYQMMYKNLPLWGQHLLIHHYPNHKNMVTGTLFSEIEKDIQSITPTLSEDAIWNKVKKQEKITQDVKFKDLETAIYIDKNKARLVYEVSYFSKKAKSLTRPTFIIDANTGEILKEWNNLPSAETGTGPGGTLGYPYEYAAVPSNVPPYAFPRFDVLNDAGICSMENSNSDIRSFENRQLTQFDFPIYAFEEGVGGNPTPFNYPCFDNPHDGFCPTIVPSDPPVPCAPVHLGNSPNNDGNFFSFQFFKMFSERYNTFKPTGNDLPLRIYTHVGDETDEGAFTNAFYIPTIKEKKKIVSHQQMILGNGHILDLFYPLTSADIVAHEIAHGVTENYSKLIYANQSGGINESFSDISAIALEQFLVDEGNTWYWDGIYAIGARSSMLNIPFRYLYDPSLDGNSINSANKYVKGMDVHFSSGIFNLAYYLISTKYNFGATDAFQLYFDANQNYWVPGTSFAYGACGVCQSAYDRGEDDKTIKKAFHNVGVDCKLFKAENQVMSHHALKKQHAAFKQ